MCIGVKACEGLHVCIMHACGENSLGISFRKIVQENCVRQVFMKFLPHHAHRSLIDRAARLVQGPDIDIVLTPVVSLIMYVSMYVCLCEC